MTQTQKILAAKTGKRQLRAGQLVSPAVDLVLADDCPAALSFAQLKTADGLLFDRNRVMLVLDALTDFGDDMSEPRRTARRFALASGMTHFYDAAAMGIAQPLAAELGLILPGELVVSADRHSHSAGALGALAFAVPPTDLASAAVNGSCWIKAPSALRVNFFGRPAAAVCGKDIILSLIGDLALAGARGKSVEFTGSSVKHIPMDDRFVISDLCAASGARNAIFETDEITLSYISDKLYREYIPCAADEGALYDRTLNIDLGLVVPTAVEKDAPERPTAVADLAGTRVSRVVIGGAVEGSYSALRTAAGILRGGHIAKGVSGIVIPATQPVYIRALESGLLRVFIEAGLAVAAPTRGCVGLLGGGEVGIATSGESLSAGGRKTGRVYIVSAATAAASALTGELTVPKRDDSQLVIGYSESEQA